MVSTSHSSFPLSSMWLIGCFFLPSIESGMYFFSTETWNTRWTPLMERVKVSLYADMDTCWHIANGHSHRWSSFLACLVIEVVLPLDQNWSPMSHRGGWFTPLSNCCFIYSWDAQRHSVSCAWRLLSCSSCLLTTGIHCLLDGIILYVGLYPNLALNGDTSMDQWSLFLNTKLVVGNSASQFSCWYRLKWWMYCLNSLLPITGWWSVVRWYPLNRFNQIQRSFSSSFFIRNV